MGPDWGHSCSLGALLPVANLSVHRASTRRRQADAADYRRLPLKLGHRTLGSQPMPEPHNPAASAEGVRVFSDSASKAAQPICSGASS